MKLKDVKEWLFDIDEDSGQALKVLEILESDQGHYGKLQDISDLLNLHGVEYIAHKDDTFNSSKGIDYVNTGDTYCPTICYENKEEFFFIASWGDIVEQNEGVYGGESCV
jgi:hypothetical protein